MRIWPPASGGELETQLKQAQDKLQQAQQNADLASNQRARIGRRSSSKRRISSSRRSRMRIWPPASGPTWKANSSKRRTSSSRRSRMQIWPQPAGRLGNAS